MRPDEYLFLDVIFAPYTDVYANLVGDRKAAMVFRRKTYVTGGVCRNGHRADRLVSNTRCAVCTGVRQEKWLNANRTLARKACCDWYARNRESVLARSRKYKEAWPEIIRQRSSEWSKRNLPKRRVANNKRRAFLQSIGGEFTTYDLELILSEQGWSCICGTYLDLKIATVDHVVPIVKGGTNDPNNLQLLCKSCNSSKGPKDLAVWMADRGNFCSGLHL